MVPPRFFSRRFSWPFCVENIAGWEYNQESGKPWRAVAMMGGFIGRKSDGDPGWITLYRGLKDLLEYGIALP